MARALKAIFFDLDDTLFATSTFALSARRAAVRAMQLAGLDLPVEALLRELDEVVAEFSSNYGHHFDKLLLRVPPESYAPSNPAVLVAAGVVAYHETKSTELEVYEDARRLLAALAETDLVRGIITAGRQIKQAEKLIRLDVLRYLSPRALFISEQIGISKPNIKLYLRACSDLGLDPTQVMYVGDNPLADLVPPHQIGMLTVRHRRCGKYADQASPVEPDYEISNFDQLATILRDDFDVDLPPAE